MERERENVLACNALPSRRSCLWNGTSVGRLWAFCTLIGCQPLSMSLSGQLSALSNLLLCQWPGRNKEGGRGRERERESGRERSAQQCVIKAHSNTHTVNCRADLEGEKKRKKKPSATKADGRHIKMTPRPCPCITLSFFPPLSTSLPLLLLCISIDCAVALGMHGATAVQK